MTTRLYQDIETVWHYMQMHHSIEKADCIFCMCSNDERVAEYAAELYLEGIAPNLTFSGSSGRLTEGLFNSSEAEHFADIAKGMGVPSKNIFVEINARNSGENVRFTATLFNQKGFIPSKILLVQKPYMERRAYATFKKQWVLPYEKVTVTSKGGRFSDYFSDLIPSSLVIQTMLGDFERLQSYPDKGFQIKQNVSDEVINAYKRIKSYKQFS